MKTSDFDYYLPERLIAQEPVPRRDESRLLVIYRNKPDVLHRTFKDLADYLNAGDLLVVNDTKVVPARLFAKEAESRAEVEVLLLKSLDSRRWEALVRPGKRARPGTRLVFAGGLFTGAVEDTTEAGGRVIKFFFEGVLEDLLREAGMTPLPPYIKKYTGNTNRYQTVYARQEGSVAAPTAGLHFTEELLGKIRSKGVTICAILLHVGLGTFRPVRVENITEHHMHAEYFEVSEDTARAIRETLDRGGRIVAVGTTTVRCLETVAGDNGFLSACRGWTDIFIYPGYRFKITGAMITNFHLPRSTLLMMVSAFAGREKILKAYLLAIEEGYRFFSFGDAMFII